MYRLNKIIVTALLLCLIASCAATKPAVRDQLVVEKLRLRITKVRNAISETRSVIAASRGAPYLAELHMRLAELLSEEARYHYMVAYEREQRSTKSLHVPQVRFLKEQAINTYNYILKRYPKTHLADRILFNISHEQRELGMFEKMKASLERLVAEYPDSPYRNEALLVLGDFHFDKTKFALAQKYFSQITDLKTSPLIGLAYYKLAWVYVNLGDCKKALNKFEKAIVTDREYRARLAAGGPVLNKTQAQDSGEFAIPKGEEHDKDYAGHKTVNVQREALVDLTYCYAQERKPEKAVGYLRGLASTREAYVAALAKMANRYALIEQPRGAAEVGRELLRLAPDDEERLDDARMLHNTLVRMKDYSSVGEDVFLILRAMRRQMLAPDLDDAAMKLLESEFELIARDLATKSHQLLMSDPAAAKKKSEWTTNPASAGETAKAYEYYLNALPDTKQRQEVVLNLADVLMEGSAFLEAGHRYREVAKLVVEPEPEPEPETAAVANKKADGKAKAQKPVKTEKQKRALRLEALYNAVVAYQSSLESEGSRGHLERAAARAGLRRAGGMYLTEGATDKEKSKKIKFAIAQSYYDEGNYLEAIDLLSGVAYEYSQDKQGEAALHMVLDSYRTINDMSGLISVGRRFLSQNSPFAEPLKAQIQPIVEAAEQNRLDELSLAASGEKAGGMEVLLAFADRYKSSDLGERAMLSAFVAARAGGDTSQLYSLGEQVVERFPDSDQSAGVVSTMGRTAAARFEFDRSIDYLERAAKMSTDQKATLLLAAGEIREHLADRSGALKNYHAALAAAGEGSGRSEAIVHLAELVERGGSSSEVIKMLTPLADPPDPEISSRLGLALLREGRHDEAEEHLRSVVEGAAAASRGAQARANYGMAEIMLHMLEEFEPLPELDAIEEAIGLVDVVLQSYLAAARLADPEFSQASLARLARAAQIGALKLEGIKLPTDLSAEETQLIREAMSRRAEALRADQGEALAECARRAKNSYLLDEAGRSCLKGIAPVKDPISYDQLSARKKAKGLKGVKDARDRLARNPEDLDALREVGQAFLNAGDSHAARLVLGRIVEAGGGADDLSLLGVASYKSGDIIGAFDAFGRAKDAGSSAAALNLAAMCSELGLKELSKEIMAEAPTQIEGVLIDKARGLKRGAR
jgi:tetratricopeptide (TPR) repeat protein